MANASYALATLWYERQRYLPGVLAIAFSALLIALQCGLLLGIFSITSLPVDSTSADVWLGGPDVQTADLARPIPERYITRLADQLEVERAEVYVQQRSLWVRSDGGLELCLIVGVQALSGLGEELTAQVVMVLAAICYAGAAILGRGFKDLDPIVPAAGSLLCGAAILIPVSLVLERPWTLQPSASSMLALLGLAVFSTALAFVIYFRLIQTLGSVGTTAQAYLRVPIGVAVGVVFLGEQPSSTAWIGLACVVIGVAAMTIPARKPSVEAA